MKKICMAFGVALAFAACGSNPNGNESIDSPGTNDPGMQDTRPMPDPSVDPGATTDTSSSNKPDSAVDVSGDQSPEIDRR